MNGTILGIVENRVLLQDNATKPNRNIFVVGGPGSYKTQSVVLTNVFNETENSIVVTDPKGEVYEKTAAVKIAQGYQVHVINFANMVHSNRYNPFDYIERDNQAEIVANKIVQSENPDGKQDVWFLTQRGLLKALILYVLKHREPAARNLKGVMEVLQENDTAKDDKQANSVSQLDQLFMDLPFTDAGRRAYELGFKKIKGEMQTGVIGSLLATLGKYTDTEVAEFTSFSDFNLQEVGKKKMALYVIIPVMDSTYSSLTNLFFTQLFDELYKAAADNHAHLAKEVDFILDEFVNLGKFPKYEEFLATCRGYGIGVTTICQTLTQLQALYGREKAESILGNHAVKICLNAANDVTAKYFSELLGKATVKVETGSESTSHSKEESHSKSDSYNYTSRSLMTPDEIMRMPETDSILVFSTERPVKAKKAFQFNLFPGADHLAVLNQNNYHGEAEPDQQKRFDQLKQMWEHAVTKAEPQAEDVAKQTGALSHQPETKMDDDFDKAFKEHQKKTERAMEET